jgi:DtxR family manganese transport transcriptional regulator
MAEDYTELLADIISEKGVARTCDLAEGLGVSHVTALRTIQRLQDDGYVLTSLRKPIELTEKGKRLARFSKRRHQLLVDFFVSIGVPAEQAEIDVEGAEHHISTTTLRCVKRFLDSD